MRDLTRVILLSLVLVVGGCSDDADVQSGAGATSNNVVNNGTDDGTADVGGGVSDDGDADAGGQRDLGGDESSDSGPGDDLSSEPDASEPDAPDVVDSDNDGVPDDEDAFPDDPDEQVDSDNDGVGDNGDAFPSDPNEQVDSDEDGVGDNADDFPLDPEEVRDADNDGVGDNADAFPFDPTEQVDSDDDGVGDNADAFPDDPAEAYDTDDDGVGDNADLDDDGDGIEDLEELAFGEDCLRSDPRNADTDGDEIADGLDPYPRDPFPEFLLRPNEQGTIDLFLSNRDGTFEEPVQIGDTLMENGRQLTYGGFSIGDFNDDGRMDFVAHSSPLVEGQPTRRFYYFFRDEKADEFEQIYIGDTDKLIAGTLTDADANGTFDIVTFAAPRDGYIASGQFQVYLNNYNGDADCVYGPTPGDGCFFVQQPALDVTDTVGGQWIARRARQAVNLNPLEDDHPDLTLVTYASGGNAVSQVYTLYGNGDGTFQPPSLNFAHNQNRDQAPANTVMFADFNNDDVGDVMLGFDDDGRPGEAWTYFGDGQGGFLTTPVTAVDINPNDAREQRGFEELGRESSGRTFDFDFDGNMDLVVGVHHTDYDAPFQTRLYLGNGDGTFGPEFIIIGAVSRFAGSFELPQRLCSTFELQRDNQE